MDQAIPRNQGPCAYAARRSSCIAAALALATWTSGLDVASAQYHSYAQVGSVLLDAQTNYPTLCRRYDLGSSALGVPMWALCLTDNVGVEEDEPEFRFVSTMHGDEVMGVEMCLNLIDYLATNYGSDTRVTNIVDGIEIWIVPCMNPDGFNAGTRGNANGIDLNRNFPDPFTSPSNTTAGREPETAVIMNWCFNQSFTLAANYHGGSLVVNYPYDNNASGSSVYTPSPDQDLFFWISEEYSRHNVPMWTSSTFDNGITNGAEWYAISGGMQDWSYRYLGANEVTIEVSEYKQPSASEIPQFWSENRESMLAYIETCLIGVRGLVTDGATGDPLSATIRVAGRDQTFYTDPDVGDYHRMLLTGTYDLTFESDGYDGLTKTGVTVSGASATRVDQALWNTTLSYPNGGEMLPAGVSAAVTWTGSPDAQFQVQFTANASDVTVIEDSFDSGVFDPAYHTGGHSAWAIDGTNTHSGPYAARSGAISNGEVSWVFRTVDCSEVSFWYNVSSESGGDYFSFYIGSDEWIHEAGTGAGWTYFSTTLSPGTYQFMWEYAKDGGGVSGSDAVWIDDLEFISDEAVWADVVALTSPGATSTPWTPTAEGDAFKLRARAYYEGSSWGSWDDSDAVFSVSAPALPGDFNGDSEVNNDDFLAFEGCFTGADGGPVDLECLPGDFDSDDDIDCLDWLQFKQAWTGPGDAPELGICPAVEAIPTVSDWGLIIMSLCLLAVGSITIRHRSRHLGPVSVGTGGVPGRRRCGSDSCRMHGLPRHAHSHREEVSVMNRTSAILMAVGTLLGSAQYCAAAGPGLHAAAASGDIRRMETLLARKPQLVNERNRRGEMPLHSAGRGLRVEAAELLLRAGAEVDARDRDGQTPLHVVLRTVPGEKDRQHRHDLTTLLLAGGADVRATDKHGRTPLHVAARRGDTALFNMLTRAGADVQAQDHNGSTPLHAAALHDNLNAIAWLLTHGADVNEKDRRGEAPLHSATRRFRRGAAERLLAGGADVDATSTTGETALHLTASVGPEAPEIDRLMTAVAEVLLDHGAAVNAHDKDGTTPLRHAISKNRPLLAELLRARGGTE